jgi:multisubunit Na+/H+ antiporter MnhC subunit
VKKILLALYAAVVLTAVVFGYAGLILFVACALDAWGQR